MNESKSKQSLPSFQKTQFCFTAAIRDPEHNPAPQDVPADRIDVYQTVIFNNIGNTLSSNFPVIYSILSEQDWQQLVRDFFSTHKSHRPLFFQIAEEFIEFLQHERNNPNDPPFLLELAHYEWLELAVDTQDVTIAFDKIDNQANLLTGKPVMSPFMQLSQYHYPVHKIGSNFQPKSVSEQDIFLIVYRTRNNQVEFMEVNTMTARLVQILEQAPGITGEHALRQLTEELHHPNPDVVVQGGTAILKQLRDNDIILGGYIDDTKIFSVGPTYS